MLALHVHIHTHASMDCASTRMPTIPHSCLHRVCATLVRLWTPVTKGDDAILDCLGVFGSLGAKLCSHDCGLRLRAVQSGVPVLDINQFRVQLGIAMRSRR